MAEKEAELEAAREAYDEAEQTHNTCWEESYGHYDDETAVDAEEAP